MILVTHVDAHVLSVPLGRLQGGATAYGEVVGGGLYPGWHSLPYYPGPTANRIEPACFILIASRAMDS